ncbi:membrane hypothetical protein [Candidatus Sulfopaludibacter sp. SbA4]|nr:membrane hypothetical protein [Candidatus Sulfopaludibacter sp. SbA4]
MTAVSSLLAGFALFLFLIGMASFGAMLKGCFVLRRLARRTPSLDVLPLLKSSLVPGVSVIANPPDASPESRDFVRRLLGLEFGNLEVVLAIEGRSETEMAAWIREFHLSRSAPASSVYESRDPLRLVVVEAGPAGALNAGLEAASAPIIGLIGTECEFDSTLLLHLIRPMLEDPQQTFAVCGLTPPPPGPAGFAAWFGALESLRSWLARGAAFAGWDLLVPVPGTSILVRRDAIQSAGGFRGGPLELFLDLHARSRAGRDSRIAFVAESVSHARVPRSWADLRRRISQDQAQIARALRKRGTGGVWAIRWGLPALFLLRLIRPVLETAALAAVAAGWMMGWIEPALAGLVLLSTAGMGILLSMAAVVLRELATFRGSDPATLAVRFLAAIPENLGYHQVRNLWLIFGFFQAK